MNLCLVLINIQIVFVFIFIFGNCIWSSEKKNIWSWKYYLSTSDLILTKCLPVRGNIYFTDQIFEEEKAAFPSFDPYEIVRTQYKLIFKMLKMQNGNLLLIFISSWIRYWILYSIYKCLCRKLWCISCLPWHVPLLLIHNAGLATLVALYFTPVGKSVTWSVGRSFKLA